MDAIPRVPRGATVLRVVGGDPPIRSERECAAALERGGWSLAAILPGADGRTTVVAERAIRMDLTALGRTRLLLAAFTAEYVAAILLGLEWANFGFASWGGEVLIALGVVGAAGFVAVLPRVEFVSEVAVIRPATTEPGPRTPVPPDGPHDPVIYDVWTARARTRNWEVLGDRGGRRFLILRPSFPSDGGLIELARALTGPGDPAGRPIRPVGFK